MSRASHRIPLCLLLLLAAVIAGCGGSSGGSETTGASGQAQAKQSEPPAQVSGGQIEKSAPGSPERTVLEWWRDVQLNDPEHALDLYLEPPSFADLAGQFNFVAGRLDGTVAVVSEQPEEDGSKLVEVRWTKPSGRSSQVSLRLSPQAGEWKLTEIPFINLLVERLQQAEAGE